jgi:membrane protease YdiL (CAAX protease family)
MKNGLQRRYGLDHLPKRSARLLYYIPMLVLATGNLWGGTAVAYPGLSQLWAVLSMAMIGYVEEVLFRGFLFKALLKKDGPTVAIIISAVTFGIGHIVNLLAGQANLETIMQVLFAIAWGFLFTFAFYKSGSLWPCILVHGLVNVFSKFSRESMTMGWVYTGATIVLAVVYCLYLARLETAPNNREA